MERLGCLRGEYMTIEITWGDTVQVSLDAPDHFCPGARGSVSGFRDLGKEPENTTKEVPARSRLYLIEFSDGITVEIPERFLIRLD
jgi:hypothetical protein